MSARKYIGPGLLIGGGVALVGGAFFAFRKAGQTTDAVEEALNASYTPGAPGALGKAPTVKLRLTGYWPFTATASERKMEGGIKDRKGQPLHTVEDFLAGKADHVSLSGDDAVWPYGQKIMIPWQSTPAGDIMITGRVTDTGGHFRGAGKVYRVMGYEPIDVCVASSATVVPKLVTATIVPGDNFQKGKAVATGNIKDQTVAAGLVEGYTTDDHNALAHAVEATLGALTDDEASCAAWALRNRAAHRGLPLANAVADLASKPLSKRACIIADKVLGGAIDPTGGATDFWLPKLQSKLHMLGEIHRAALSSGDEQLAAKYAPFAKYGTVDAVRGRLAREGSETTCVVGCVELLRRA